MSKIESRCGLFCSECSFRKTHNCGGCVETNGNPFHGECPVAKCCQDKGFMHCGECPNIPKYCGETDCKKKDGNTMMFCFEMGDGNGNGNAEQVKAAYEVLKKGAITCSPLTDSCGYSPLQFVCTDKYGVTWCLFV